MGGLKDGVASDEVLVGTRGNANATNLSGEGVTEVVTVEVGAADNGEVLGAGEDLLEGNIGDNLADEHLVLPLAVAVGAVDSVESLLDLLDGTLLLGVGHHVVAGLEELGVGNSVGHTVVAVADDPGLALSDALVAELGGLGKSKAPASEGTLGELHDVTLVDESHAGAVEGDGVLEGSADDTLGTLLGDGLDAEAGGLREANLLGNAELLEKLVDLLGLRGASHELNTGVDILGVLTEDVHLNLLRLLDGGGHTLEVAHGAVAHVEVELLAEGDVEGADATTKRGGEGSLDTNAVVAEGLKGSLGEPLTGLAEGLLTGEDLLPHDLALTTVSLLDGGIEDADTGVPDIRASTVTSDEGDDGVVGDNNVAVIAHADGGTSAVGSSAEGANTTGDLHDTTSAKGHLRHDLLVSVFVCAFY